jgi:hypothetical protein
MQIPFVGGAYLERSMLLDAQRCVNFFPVLGESGTAKAVRALYGTPGLRRLTTLAAAGCVRGAWKPTDGSDAIVVCGAYVYRVKDDWTSTQVGTVDSVTTPVVIRDNGEYAVIATGDRGYSLNLTTNTFAQILDPAFYGASHVEYLDTYFIFNRPGTNQLYISGSNALTFDALDFGSAESNAESIIAHIVSHSELIVFKETVTEVWSDSGNTDFPLARNTNAAIKQGCAAPYSVVEMDNTIFWLGNAREGGGIVWRLNGYTPTRVSTSSIETAIAGYGDISDAVAYSYQQEGHTFYVLSFPAAGATWVYDAATRLWHERAYLDPATGTLGRHRSNCHVNINGTHVVGDWENGKLYALDLDYYSDDGDPLPAIRAAAHIADSDYKRIRHDRLHVDIEPGIGLQTGQGSNPLAVLQISNNGGKTWGNAITASLGLVGQYQALLIWRRLGIARDRVYRLTITDPVKRVVLGATLNPEL